jgi:hypothetical protein
MTLSLGSYPSWGEGSEPVSGNGASAGLQPVVKKPIPLTTTLQRWYKSSRELSGSYQTGSAWLRFSSFMNQRWEGFQKSQLAPMTEWASRQLGLARTTTAFYPFSGADFVNSTPSFPMPDLPHGRSGTVFVMEITASVNFGFA